MNPVLYEIIVSLAEALISGVFLVNMLESKYHKGIFAALFGVGVTVAMICTSPFSAPGILIVALVELLFVFFMFEDKITRRLGVFFIAEGLMVAASAVAYLVYTLVADADASVMLSCRAENCTYCLLYLLLYSVFTSVVYVLVMERGSVEFPFVVGTQAVVGIGEVFAVLAVAGAYGGNIDSQRAWLIIASVVCMVVANVAIGMLVPYLMREVVRSNDMDYGKELSNMEYKYYEMSVENDKKLRSIRHDISNHIQTVYSLISNGDNKRGLELINELKARYALVDRIVYCNNPVINIILTNKRIEAEEKNIETHIRVKEDLENMPITDFDLSTVICNLLDNAIRGCVCSEQSHPRLIVEILQKNQYLVVRVLNSCRVGMNIESTDRIDTTKTSSTVHGLGMSIISSIAKRYRGDFMVAAQNGIFTATVVMSLKNKQQS